MLVAFGVGVMLGVLIVIGLLKLTMTNDPFRGLVLLGIIIFLFIWMITVLNWIVFTA